MTIRTDRIVVDTNVWIFGLRRTPAFAACGGLLDRLGELSVVIPRQILQELRANLNDEELRTFFVLVNAFPRNVVLDWSRAPEHLVMKFLTLGCRRGDAMVAAHAESLAASSLVSENRDFLADAPGLPFRIISASEALAELELGGPGP